MFSTCKYRCENGTRPSAELQAPAAFLEHWGTLCREGAAALRTQYSLLLAVRDSPFAVGGLFIRTREERSQLKSPETQIFTVVVYITEVQISVYLT